MVTFMAPPAERPSERRESPAKPAVHAFMAAKLRDATRALHDDLEANADVLARLRSPAERQQMIESYLAMLGQAAVILDAWLSTPADRSRAGQPARTDAEAPVLADGMEVLGFDYVMKGSALGGRIMLRELEREGVSTDGLGFLDPFGARTGEVWRETLGRLEGVLADEPDAFQQVISGARKAYGFARAHLCERCAA